MKNIINRWLFFGHFVYWIFWIGSMVIFGVKIWEGIIIGVISYVVWPLIFRILLFIEQ